MCYIFRVFHFKFAEVHMPTTGLTLNTESWNKSQHIPQRFRNLKISLNVILSEKYVRQNFIVFVKLDFPKTLFIYLWKRNVSSNKFDCQSESIRLKEAFKKNEALASENEIFIRLKFVTSPRSWDSWDS